MNARLFSLIMSILLVTTLVWFLLYFNGASNTITSNNATVTIMNDQITSLQGQLKSANTQIADLKNQLHAANVSFSDLQTQDADALTKISDLQTSLNKANAQISTLQGQLGTSNTQVTTLQGQLNTANAQITTLQTQSSTTQGLLDTANAALTNAQSRVSSLTSITNLTVSTTVFGPTSIAANSQVISFVSGYAGFLQISAATGASSGNITVTSTYGSYPYSTTIAINTVVSTAIVPILSGTVTVYYGSGNTTDTATVGIIYYY